MKKYALFLLFMSGVMPLAAQYTQRVSIGNKQDAGITYTLPQTSLRVTVDAQCTTVKAGPFAQFAEKLLGIADAPQDSYVAWQITGIAVEPFAVPDTAKTYHIHTANLAQMPTIHLTEEGMLWCINCEPQLPAVVEEVAAEEPAAAPKQLHAVNVMNEEMLKAGSKSKQAEIAARQIFRIRESRQNLLTGDVDNYPADGASFQLVLDNLEAQEKAYLELFTGVKSVTTDKRSFLYTPTAAVAGNVLFRFSRHYGFVEADDLVGEPYELNIEVIEDNTEVPVLTDAKGRVRPAATGIAYNVPGKLHYVVAYRGEALAQGNVAAAQFGHVEQLSQTQFADKRIVVKATFDLLTGNIKIYE